MTHKLRLPHYFSTTIRQQMSEMYWTMAIADIAIALVMIFEPIFLYSVLKFSLQEVLLFMGAVYALYIVLIPFGAKIVSYFGYKHSIFLSIPFQILYWFLLFGSQENISLIYFAPVAFAIEKSLFWPAFHASIARFAHGEQRGREFSMLNVIVNASLIVGPLVGGFLAQQLGVHIAFLIASGIYFCSFIPLLASRDGYLPKQYNYTDTLALYRAFPKKFLGYLGFGEELLVLTIWPIFIYVAVSNYQSTGALATVATFVATLLALYIGKVTDQYSKRLLLRVGAFFYTLVWIFRFIAVNFWSAFSIDTLSRTSKDLVFIPLSTLTHERAEATQIMPYVVFFEQSLAIGKLLAAALGLIVLAVFGASFMPLFVLGALFALLYMFI